MKAASENLTPVVLELGGKSPCFVDKDANLEVSARRIISGKFGNSGQTCVAPDYLLVHKDIEAKFISTLNQTIHEFYGENPQQCPDYSRVVNERHTQRLASLLEGEEIIHGGKYDVQDHYVEPTLVKTDLTKNTKLMQDEIFGPILPIATFTNLDEAINYVNSKPKPLALYVFSNNSKISDYVLSHTSSGGAAVNETVFHVAIKTLPFGGVGPSGTGAYGGKATFDTFSHHKSVFYRNTLVDPMLRYPPHTPSKIYWFKKAASFKLPSKKIFVFAVLGLVAFIFEIYRRNRSRL
jgi:aldehyde dehydrogenase (NAD+)